MCDSDRVEEKGAAAATGDGEWLGGAGRGAGGAMPLDYMPPRTCTSPAPCTRPRARHIYYLRGPDSGKGAGSSPDI